MKFLLLLPLLALAQDSTVAGGEYYPSSSEAAANYYPETAGVYPDGTAVTATSGYTEPVYESPQHEQHEHGGPPSDAELTYLAEVIGAPADNVIALARDVEAHLQHTDVNEEDIINVVKLLAPAHGITDAQIELAFLHMEEKSHHVPETTAVEFARHHTASNYNEALGKHEAATSHHEQKAAELADAINAQNEAAANAASALGALEETNKDLAAANAELAKSEAERLAKAATVHDLENLVASRSAEHEAAVNRHNEATGKKEYYEQEMGAAAQQLEEAIQYMAQMKAEHEAAVTEATAKLAHETAEVEAALAYLATTKGHQGEAWKLEGEAEAAAKEADQAVLAAESQLREEEAEAAAAKAHLESLGL